MDIPLVNSLVYFYYVCNKIFCVCVHLFSQLYYSLLAMKIQRVSANTKGVISFSLSETNFSGGEDNTNISIPSAIFLGEGIRFRVFHVQSTPVIADTLGTAIWCP